jgi:hypothetical protein
MAARALTTLLMMPLMACALERLDDFSMSDVVAQEGIRLLTEYEATIDSVQYFDDKNPSDSNDTGGGYLSFIDVNLATRAQQIIDIEVVNGTDSSLAGIDRTGRTGVRLSSDEFPIDLTVGDLKINGESIGRVGMTDYTTGGVSPIVFDLWAGGYDEDSNGLADESGLTLDVIFPKESSYTIYYEEDGTRLSSNVNYCADDACTTGGLVLEDITIDVVAEGLRLGLPTINNGTFNISDFRIGTSDDDYSDINELSFSNINIGAGGYIILGAPTDYGETAITFDMELAETNFDFTFYDITDTAKNRITTNIQISGLDGVGVASANGEINILEIVTPLDGSPKTGGLHIDYEAELQIVATDFTMQGDGVTDAPVLGSFELNLQILSGSYLEVMGH